MNSLRKWFYRPRKDDPSLMAQFYYADDELNMVAAELDSFDGRKDPERCTALVNQLRQCQDRVLNICIEMMDEVIPEERASRDFRVKFPDDVMQENLAGQLWFGAECLAAGSSIMNREAESSRMRPLAKAVTKTIETVRNLLREQCLKPVPEYTEKIRESLKIFDRLFAEFELSYVSAMVPVKSVEEHDVQQNVVVLFSETVQRALKLGLTSQDQIDDYDPALMFTIPRLAIVAGLVMFPDGPLNLDREPRSLSELFRPFRTLLSKIRELLWTMSTSELAALEKALCSMEEPDPSSQILPDESPQQNSYGHASFTSDFVQKFYANYPSCKVVTPELSSLYQPGKKPAERYERKRERTSGKSRGSRSRARQERQSEKFLARLNATVEDRPRAKRRSRRSHAQRHHQNPPADSDSGEEHHHGQSSHHRHPRPSSSTSHHHPDHHIPPPPPPPQGSHHSQRHHRSKKSRHQPVSRIKTIVCSCGTVNEYERGGVGEGHQSPRTLSPQHEGSMHPPAAPSTASCDSFCDIAASGRCAAGPSHIDPCTGLPHHTTSTEAPETECRETQDLAEGVAHLTVDNDCECSVVGCGAVCAGVVHPRCHSLGEDCGTQPSVHHSSPCTTQDSRTMEEREAEAGCREGSCVEGAGGHEAAQPLVLHFPKGAADSFSPKSQSGHCSSGSTSPYNSGAEDDEEVALALQAAEVAATWRARARFTDAQDLIHRLFVCISGVADQLQTNYASDLRKILKCVFLMNQSPPEEPPKTQEPEQPEWSASSPIHSYGDDNEDDAAENSSAGHDSEQLSVESAEDALVVIGSPDHHHRCHSPVAPTEDTPQDYSPHSSPPSSSPVTPPPEPPPDYSPRSTPPCSLVPPQQQPDYSPHSTPPCSPITPPHLSSQPFPSLDLPASTSSTSSALRLHRHHHLHHHHTAPTDIPLSATTALPASSPSSPVCPPSIQVPAAIFNDHALMQFSEVTQASIPPNVELLPHPQVQYAESFGVIPEPFTRPSHDQSLGSHEGVDLSPGGSQGRGGLESGRTRHRVQEPPAWVPDQQAPRCMACGAAFTMVRRRHHCRNCGKVFCAHCSQHAVPLPHFGIWKAVRVCNVCFLYYVTFTTETTTTTTPPS